MKNTYGSALALTIFGESHGAAIGAVLDGVAAGVPVDEARVAACMDKRRARGDGLSTARVEADQVQFLSGVVNGHTTGTAIALMIENQNTRSGDYAKTADLLRPGHADYTAYAKYHGFQDARGGGHFSGRVTAALVAGGAIVLDALSRAGIDISTHIARCAGISDTPFALDDPAALAAQAEALVGKPEGFALLDTTVEEPMKAAIRAAGADGDSVGGILETAILGLPAGRGWRSPKCRPRCRRRPRRPGWRLSWVLPRWCPAGQSPPACPPVLLPERPTRRGHPARKAYRRCPRTGQYGWKCQCPPGSGRPARWHRPPPARQ